MENTFACKILNITSKAGLSYTGRLHAIDTKHSTVTLSKVRVDNSTTGDQVSLKVYDYVIFRGIDIQDVTSRDVSAQDALLERDLAVLYKVKPLAERIKVQFLVIDNILDIVLHTPSNSNSSMIDERKGWQQPQDDVKNDCDPSQRQRVPFRPTYSTSRSKRMPRH